MFDALVVKYVFLYLVRRLRVQVVELSLAPFLLAFVSDFVVVALADVTLLVSAPEYAGDQLSFGGVSLELHPAAHGGGGARARARAR